MTPNRAENILVIYSRFSFSSLKYQFITEIEMGEVKYKTILRENGSKYIAPNENKLVKNPKKALPNVHQTCFYGTSVTLTLRNLDLM